MKIRIPKIVTNPLAADKEFHKNQNKFEQLPDKTKELELLRDQAEKTTGQEGAALHQVIRDKSRHLG